jgi:hypothetical protein
MNEERQHMEEQISNLALEVSRLKQVEEES